MLGKPTYTKRSKDPCDREKQPRPPYQADGASDQARYGDDGADPERGVWALVRQPGASHPRIHDG